MATNIDLAIVRADPSVFTKALIAVRSLTNSSSQSRLLIRQDLNTSDRDAL